MTAKPPRQRKDGRCCVCLKPRRRPSKGHKSALAAWEQDSFCSTECAKQHYGVRMGESAEFVYREREFDAALEAAG